MVRIDGFETTSMLIWRSCSWCLMMFDAWLVVLDAPFAVEVKFMELPAVSGRTVAAQSHACIVAEIPRYKDWRYSTIRSSA